MAINMDKAQLGVGSEVLSWKTLDQLKKVDEKNTVGRIDTKIQENLTKKKDLTAIKTLLSSFKSSVAGLTDDTSYLKRKVDSTGSGSATLSASTGVNEQNIDLSVQQIATQSVFQSKKFDTDNTPVAATDVSFKIKVGDKDYDVNLSSGDSLSDIASKINEATDGKVQAKVLNVGGDKPYRLIIQSKDTGLDNAISFKYGVDAPGATTTNKSEDLFRALGLFFKEPASSNDTLELMSDQEIDDYNNTPNARPIDKTNIGAQITQAGNAKFTFNGIAVERATNNIDDFMMGLTITLNKVDKEGESSNFAVVQDTENLVEDLQDMVKAYNELTNNLSVATDYDTETGNAGTFQGVSEIRQIRSQLNSIINGVDPKSGKSIGDFGLSLSKDGILVLDQTKMKETLSSNFEEFQAFFASKTTYENVSYVGADAVKEATSDIKGKFKVNGKEVELNITAGTSAEDVAKEVAKKIAASGADVTVSIDKDNKLKFAGIAGGKITIEADDGGDALLAQLGIAKTDLAGKSDKTNGFFKQLNNVMEGLVGKSGTLTTYEESLSNEAKNLKDEKEITQERIDKKYETMAEKWSRYDTMIAQMQQQMNTITQMIEAAYNQKN